MEFIFFYLLKLQLRRCVSGYGSVATPASLYFRSRIPHKNVWRINHSIKRITVKENDPGNRAENPTEHRSALLLPRWVTARRDGVTPRHHTY